MKKIITLSLALVIATSAFAQRSISAGFMSTSFDYEGGLLQSSFAYQLTERNSFTWFIAASQDFSLSNLTGVNNLGIRPGARISLSTCGDVEQQQESYFDVSGVVTYGLHLKSGKTLTPYVGPIVSLGISSKVLDSDWETISNNYDDPLGYKRLDFMLRFGASFDFKPDKWRLFAEYNMGLLDRLKTDEANFKKANVVFGISRLF